MQSLVCECERAVCIIDFAVGAVRAAAPLATQHGMFEFSAVIVSDWWNNQKRNCMRVATRYGRYQT